jgi:hypothetical protein
MSRAAAMSHPVVMVVYCAPVDHSFFILLVCCLGAEVALVVAEEEQARLENCRLCLSSMLSPGTCSILTMTVKQLYSTAGSPHIQASCCVVCSFGKDITLLSLEAFSP